VHRKVQRCAAVAVALVDVHVRVEEHCYDALVAAVDGYVEQRLAVATFGRIVSLRGRWSVFAGQGGGGRDGSVGATGP